MRTQPPVGSTPPASATHNDGSPDDFGFRRWQPPKDTGLRGDFAKNTALGEIERLDLSAFGKGPEDLAIDPNGAVYAGLENGVIVRFPPGSTTPELFAKGLGRPLGMEFAPNGKLIVCDAKKGLLSVDPTGAVTVLATSAGGQPLVFPNNLAVQRDGTVYFTDSSRRFPQSDYFGEVLAHDDGGRLLRYDPRTRSTTVMQDGLYFPNGVALSRDEDFLVVAEMNKYRLLRTWLKGPNQGKTDVLVDRLPGFPDNVSTDENGNFWVGISGLRSPVLDKTLPHPWARKLISLVPRAWLPKPARHGFVVAFDPTGRVVQNLQDPSGRYADTTSAQPFGRDLFVSSLEESAIGRLRLPLR